MSELSRHGSIKDNKLQYNYDQNKIIFQTSDQKEFLEYCEDYF